MIVVDTSIWIDHERAPVLQLNELLRDEAVRVHPLVLGELACGFFAHRALFLRLLKNLPQSIVAAEDEVLIFLENHKLYGQGIGYIDVHILASTILSGDKLWTRDKRLAQIASNFSIGYIEQP